MSLTVFKNWQAYQRAFVLAEELFRLTARFPKEERYSLTDQVRRSSRSVCANMAEASAKRFYPKHFRSKLTDCAGEIAETQTWIDFALSCGYLEAKTHQHLNDQAIIVGKLISYMIRHPTKFGAKPHPSHRA